MTEGRGFLILALIAMGAGWGITNPLTKIAVSTGHQPFGLVFWQLVIGAAFLGVITFARGKGLPFKPRHIRLYVVIALLGTILPNAASYRAAVHLPAGVMAILISMVPMFAFPIALGMGLDRFSWRRIGGLSLGLAGVALLVGPEASLPDRSMVAWIPIALIAPFFYGIEGNYVAKFGTEDLGPIQTLFGASVVGAILALILAVASGQFIDPRGGIGAPEWALIGSSSVHALVYACYVWMVRKAGSVFAAQVAYLVTVFGVLWSLILLGEGYSPFIWAALGAMLAGIALVNPRRKETLATP